MSDYSGSDIWHDTITLPADNTRPSAGTFNLASEPIIDNERYLKNRGVRGTHIATSVVDNGQYAKITGSTWQTLPQIYGLVPHLTIASVEVGDIVVIDVAGWFYAVSTALGYGLVGVEVIEDYGGSNLTTQLEHTRHYVLSDTSGGTNIGSHASLNGSHIITAQGALRIRVQGKGSGFSGTVGLASGARLTFRAVHHRPFTP